MGNLTLLRFMEEFMSMGCSIKIEHVGKGIYTDIEITKEDSVCARHVPSNHLRDPVELEKVRDEISQHLEL